ncbi:NAD(P)H-dependent oxidoreductase [Paenibacillus sp. DCT19]|uniref:NAD(P)H-dependent oxidoreductase n=1 Tax=Paenibacillus sp. DCT19 TaxID=2211212 RepID=UPI0020C248B8|nr:NAD(P)H-dependent oxidoreductase [Paenibacillus sp. DCT19]
MANVLYVTAHPLNTDTYSLSVGNQFIKTYKKFNPKDVISHLDLYRTDLPQIDADILGHWGNHHMVMLLINYAKRRRMT